MPNLSFRAAMLAAIVAIAATTGGGSAAFAEGGDSLKARVARDATVIRTEKQPRRMSLLTPKVVAKPTPVAKAAPVPAIPAMRWGRQGSDAWTRELLAALEQDASGLARVVPQDVQAFCPGYVTASVDQRKHFWAGLVSSIAKHESTWNPRAKGGGGKWLGLMQIAPATWRAYDCRGEIMDGGDNLSCAVRIMAKQVGRDGVIAGGGARGVGRDWAPMRSGSKRADIAGWTRQQSYCTL